MGYIMLAKKNLKDISFQGKKHIIGKTKTYIKVCSNKVFWS